MAKKYVIMITSNLYVYLFNLFDPRRHYRFNLLQCLTGTSSCYVIIRGAYSCQVNTVTLLQGHCVI